MADKKFCIAVKSVDQLNAGILKLAGTVVYCPEEYSVNIVKAFLITAETLIKKSGVTAQIYLDLPAAAMSEDIKLLREILIAVKDKIAGIVANNVYGLQLGKEYDLDVIKGAGLNTLNDNFCDFKNILLSPEIYEGDYRMFKDWDKKNYYLYVFGRQPLMLLKHCPYQVNGFDCKSCGGVKLQYKDELGNLMDIRRVKLSDCSFELLNGVPLNLLKYKNKVKPHYYFDMREYSAADILKTLTLFYEPGNKDPEGKYTTGLYFKGIK